MEKTIRQIAREKAVIAVYQWLTVDASKEELKEYVHADEALLEGRSAEQFCYWLIETVMAKPCIPESGLRWILRAGYPMNSGHRLRRS